MADREKRSFESRDYDGAYFEGHLLRYRSPVYRQRVTHVKRYLGDIRGKRVLDLGCGVGFFSELCLNLGAEVASMDFSIDALAFCREEYGDRLVLTRGDAASLPYLDGSFDLVLMNDIIEHLTPEIGMAMLQETRRVLKRGGAFILDTDNERYLMNRPGLRRLNAFLQRNTDQRKALAEIKKDNPAPSLHVKIYDVEELRSLFREIGFVTERSEVYPYIAVPIRDAFFRFFLFRPLFRWVKGDVQIHRCRKP